MTTTCEPSLSWLLHCEGCQCYDWDFSDNAMTYEQCQQYALDNGFTHISHNSDGNNLKCRVADAVDCATQVTEYKEDWDTWILVEEPCTTSTPTGPVGNFN